MTDSPNPPAPFSLLEHLGQVPDPRVRRTQRHELLDILAIALCAVIAGTDHWTEMVEFGQAKFDWFARQGVVAIDGKSVRGAREDKKHPLHIVSA